MEPPDLPEKIKRFDTDYADKVLYAIGPAAAGAGVWEETASALDGSVDLRAIRLPGRESRFLEGPLCSVDLQVRDLLAEIRAEIEDECQPYSLVGMCSGAVLAFELAVALEETENLEKPDSLIVINPIPLTGAAGKLAGPGSGVSTEKWLSNVAGMPVKMITPEVMEVFGPTIEADLAALGSYEYGGKILTTSITVVRSRSDGPLPTDNGHDWSTFTAGRCELVETQWPTELDADLGILISSVLP
jgi:medium-chain acyl-[acyl-carrier-protein] hydrolase